MLEGTGSWTNFNVGIWLFCILFLYLTSHSEIKLDNFAEAHYSFHTFLNGFQFC